MPKTLTDIKKALDSNLGKDFCSRLTEEEERPLNVQGF